MFPPLELDGFVIRVELMLCVTSRAEIIIAQLHPGSPGVLLEPGHLGVRKPSHGEAMCWSPSQQSASTARLVSK